MARRDRAEGVTLDVPGLRQLRRDLKRLGDDLADLKDTNQQVGDLVAVEAATRAPRRSGRLAGTGRAARAVGRATVTFGGGTVRYAGVIHHGWAERNITAQPFAYEAADATRPEWLALYQAGINAQIAKLDPTY